MSLSSWEDYLYDQITKANLPTPVREYKFCLPRRFRFDFAWPEIKFAVEVHGAVYSGGRHVTGAGFSKDCEKLALAAIKGYRTIQVTTGQVSAGQALEWITEYFKQQVDNK